MATTLYRGDDQRALLANPADDAASSTEDDATASPQQGGPVDFEAEAVLFRKRHGDASQYIGNLKVDLVAAQSKIDELTAERDRLKSGDLTYVPKTPEEIAAWTESYPDVANSIRTMIDTKVDASASRFKELEEKLAESVLAGQIKDARTALLSLHADAEEIRQTRNFHDWVRGEGKYEGKPQSKEIQALLYDNATDASAAGTVITLYKASTGIITPTKQTQSGQTTRPNLADAAFAVSGDSSMDIDMTGQDGKPIFRESEINKLKGHEFDELEEAIDLANKEGRIIYDVASKFPNLAEKFDYNRR